MCHNANDAARIDRGDRGDRDEPPVCLRATNPTAQPLQAVTQRDAERRVNLKRNGTSNTFNKICIFSVMLFNRFVKLGG